MWVNVVKLLLTFSHLPKNVFVGCQKYTFGHVFFSKTGGPEITPLDPQTGLYLKNLKHHPERGFQSLFSVPGENGLPLKK